MSTSPARLSDIDSQPAPQGFELIQALGYSLIFALMGLSIAIPQTGFLEMFKSDVRQMDAESFAQLFLLIAMLVLAVRWIGATRKEMRLWLTWTSIKQEPAEALGAIIGVSFYLGLSVGFVARPVLITGYFTLGTAFSIWTQCYCNRQFAAAGPRQGATIPCSMTHYWTRRPQCLRIALITFFSLVALVFALTGWLRPQSHATVYFLAAYWILFFDIVLAEVQIRFWRTERDNGIERHIQGTVGSATEDYVRSECRLQGILTILPVVSFLAQMYFSIGAGTLTLLLHHNAVAYADWLLIPFNFYATRAINWSRGITLYIITVISVVLSLLTHAVWVIQHADPGHMISSTGVVLAAGWVHIGFSICQMVVLVSFVFCLREGAPVMMASFFGCAYFVALGVGGFVMHHGHLILSDAVVLVSGLLFMAILPGLHALQKGRESNMTSHRLD